jgi:hypothetical protein
MDIKLLIIDLITVVYNNTPTRFTCRGERIHTEIVLLIDDLTILVEVP